VVTELTMLLSNFASFKSSSFFCSNSVLSWWITSSLPLLCAEHINNILQLSMYHCMTYIQEIQSNSSFYPCRVSDMIYKKYNQTVVSIHAGFLTWYNPFLCYYCDGFPQFLYYYWDGYPPIFMLLLRWIILD
jgi:hypothetical protein